MLKTLQDLPKRQSFGRGNSTKLTAPTKEKATLGTTGSIPINLHMNENDYLKTAIRMLEKEFSRQGEYMSQAQIFDLIRKATAKQMYGTKDY